MIHCMRSTLGVAAVALILMAAQPQPAGAAPPAKPYQPKVGPTTLPNPLPGMIKPHDLGTRPIGGDWWRTYPWSPYNAWQNPYWYPPYNRNYPYPPDQAYPYYPYPVPRPYPVPPPLPWGIGSHP